LRMRVALRRRRPMLERVYLWSRQRAERLGWRSVESWFLLVVAFVCLQMMEMRIVEGK